MGKVEENKKQKKDLLLKTAFRLFTEKGFSKTTISDIVQMCIRDRFRAASMEFTLFTA